MATYKVIQDIEAEDKFVGPLTFKQFVFAGIAVTCAYLSFIALTKHLKFLLFFTSPVIAITAFLAWPWSRDQPTEVWALAKIRFMFKPRRRIWNQTGMQELVTITAPKKVEKQMTNGLTSNEVKSRLRALAHTIDSRGWAVKNVNVNLYAPPVTWGNEATDRLLGFETIAPAAVPAFDIRADEDMLDPQHNPTAQHLNQMMASYDQSHRQALLSKVKRVSKKLPGREDEAVRPNYWFMHQNAATSSAPGQTSFNDTSVVTPGAADDLAAVPTTDEQTLLQQAHVAAQASNPLHSRHHVIQPLSQNDPSSSVSAVTPPQDPAILNLATNDDLDVATIARQAHKDTRAADDNEVVIPLR
jgi:hypothetical protein